MARRTLAVQGRSLKLVPTWHGGIFDETAAGDALMPAADAETAPTTFDEWLAPQRIQRDLVGGPLDTVPSLEIVASAWCGVCGIGGVLRVRSCANVVGGSTGWPGRSCRLGTDLRLRPPMLVRAETSLAGTRTRLPPLPASAAENVLSSRTDTAPSDVVNASKWRARRHPPRAGGTPELTSELEGHALLACLRLCRTVTAPIVVPPAAPVLVGRG